jgi:hypothetical protein
METGREGGLMTDAEWLTCRHPGPMLDHLRDGVNDPRLAASHRVCLVMSPNQPLPPAGGRNSRRWEACPVS